MNRLLTSQWRIPRPCFSCPPSFDSRSTVIYSHDSNLWVSRNGPLSQNIMAYSKVNNEGCQWRHRILLTCRLIYNDGRAQWYSSTFFTFPNQHIFQAFFLGKPKFLSCIQRLHITNFQEGPSEWLDPLTSLETLTLDVPLIIAYWSEYTPLRHLEQGSLSPDLLFNEFREELLNDRPRDRRLTWTRYTETIDCGRVSPKRCQ